MSAVSVKKEAISVLVRLRSALITLGATLLPQPMARTAPDFPEARKRVFSSSEKRVCAVMRGVGDLPDATRSADCSRFMASNSLVFMPRMCPESQKLVPREPGYGATFR